MDTPPPSGDVGALMTLGFILFVLHGVCVVRTLFDVHEKLFTSYRSDRYKNRRELQWHVLKGVFCPFYPITSHWFTNVKKYKVAYSELPAPENTKKIETPTDPLKGHVQVVKDE